MKPCDKTPEAGMVGAQERIQQGVTPDCMHSSHSKHARRRKGSTAGSTSGPAHVNSLEEKKERKSVCRKASQCEPLHPEATGVLRHHQ